VKEEAVVDDDDALSYFARLAEEDWFQNQKLIFIGGKKIFRQFFV
jgi:hypothetical protein